MFLLYPEQLPKQLNKKLSTAYFLIGNDPLLLLESYYEVRKAAVERGFKEHYTFQIDRNTDWQVIFSLCRTRSIFSARQTIQLLLSEKNYNSNINKQLAILVSLLHDDMLLIIQSNKFTKPQESSSWFLSLSPHSIQVICFAPKQEDLVRWIISRAKKHGIQLDDEACQFLCYSYEGNLSALAQELKKLSILFPDKKLTVFHVKKTAEDESHFSPIHWVDALLMAKGKRALRILQQLRLEGMEPVILIRALQKELFLLLNLQRESAKMPLQVLFKKYLVWKSRQATIIEAYKRISKEQVFHAVHTLTRIELTIKQDYYQPVWNELESVSLLLCNNSLLNIFFMIS